MPRQIAFITFFLSVFYFQVVRADFEVETLAQAVLQTYTEDHDKLVRKSNPKEEFQWNDRALKSSEYPNIVLRRYISRIPPGSNRYVVMQTDENGKTTAYPENLLLIAILKENSIKFDALATLKKEGVPLAKHRNIYKVKGKYIELLGYRFVFNASLPVLKEVEYKSGMALKSEDELKKEFYFPTALTNAALLKNIGLLQKGASFTSIEGKVTFPYHNGGKTLEYTLEQSSMTPKRLIIDPDRLVYKYEPRAILKTITVKEISKSPSEEKQVAKLDLTQTTLPTIGDNDIVLGTPGAFKPYFAAEDVGILDIELPETQIRQKIRQFPSDKTFYVLFSPKSDFLSQDIKTAIKNHKKLVDAKAINPVEIPLDLSQFAYDDIHYYAEKKLFQNVRYVFESVSNGYVVMRVDPL